MNPQGPIAPPTEAADRKAHPLASGCLDYFPDALLAVAHVSKLGNDQHNPGEPLHWAKHKSRDEADALLRHFLQRGTMDSDGVRHSAKVAWRALAMLQREIEMENGWGYDEKLDAWIVKTPPPVIDNITDLMKQSGGASPTTATGGSPCSICGKALCWEPSHHTKVLGRDAYRDRP